MERTVAAPPAPHAKQYVFVDEYNRHKRLKVMRACDGCRKRKIRCDGALQNGPWPCGACVRLKLKCVPPTLEQDDETGLQSQSTSNGPGQFLFQNSTVNSDFGNTPRQTASPAQTNYSWSASTRTPLSTAPTSAPSQHDNSESVYFNPNSSFPQASSDPRLDAAFSENDYLATASVPNQFQLNDPVPGITRAQTELSNSSNDDPEEVDAAVKGLTEQMGDLRVDISSMSPWISQQGRGQSEMPAPVADDSNSLLPASVMSDTKVRIPPEMMPLDERVMDYFGYYFDYIHPYIPVLDKQALYDQWRTAKSTVSPLLLEGIFACVSRYLEQPLESRRWLALAAKHEESYKDVPRISTVQAMLILIKAREFLPKPGYFYRSWMACKYVVTMAMDLGLHEHHDQHLAGRSCKLKRTDCLTQTRIWQTLFGFELFIGGPQGRSDFLIEHESVDVDFPFPSPDVDAFEYNTQRRYAIFAQAMKNTKITNMMFQSGRRGNKDWAVDTQYRQHDKDLVDWLHNLPPDMQIHYPEDGSAPWLGGDHFVANVHAYHHLVVVMHHRPQLQALLERKDPNWKTHLDICAHSATMICKLQEALLRDFGLHGLLFMIRGINFTVYCILSCIMLHLVAITSPDPALNSQARTYFTRHMRVLEACTGSTGPEVQAQINALREAFSRDTSKPFELKPSLGMRSPVMDNNLTPPTLHQQPVAQPVHAMTSAPQDWTQLQPAKTTSPTHEYPQPFDTASVPSTMPNLNALSYDPSNFAVPSQQSSPYTSTNFSPVTSGAYNTSTYPLDRVASNEQQPAAPAWDPSGIFTQWNTAFGNPTQPSPPQTRYPQAGPGASSLQQPYAAQTSPVTAGVGFYPTPVNSVPPQQPQAQQTQQSIGDNGSAGYGGYGAQQTVTPVMWQDAFTHAYVSGHGQKRYRDEAGMDGLGGWDGYGSKRRG